MALQPAAASHYLCGTRIKPAAVQPGPAASRRTCLQPAQQRPSPRHVCRANYRWSAGDEQGRKRESLFDANNRQQPTRGDGSPVNNLSDGSDWPEEWQQWVDAADGTDRQQEQSLADQEQEWEAAAPASSGLRSGRLGRRRAAAAAPGDDGSSTGMSRLAQLRQQVAQQAAAASVGETAVQQDVWGQAELRQIRRQRAAEAAAAAGELPPVPDQVAQEWGPLEAAPAAAAASTEEWGWAAESWAGGRGNGSTSRAGQQQAPGQQAAGSGPGSWELAQQQRELRRQRRREQAAAGRATQAGTTDASADGNGAAPGGQTGGTGWQQQQQYGQQYGDADEQYSEMYEPGASVEPNIALLSTAEVDRVLPLVPRSQQAAFYNGSATDSVQRWFAALATTVVVSKVALLAASSLTWPLWWPWAQAANKNLALKRQYRYCGLWRTQVLDVSVTGRPKPFTSLDGGGGGTLLRMARILVGDPGGAQTEMLLPYDSRYELIQAGQPAELLALSNDAAFRSFKAVKDVYLPGSGLWVSEYPYADRSQFLQVSLEVEREAQEEVSAQQYGADAGAPAGQPGEQQQYSGGWQQDDYRQ
ncbi:hypothetical protein D9Q98_003281 [Chlorella vulgaris]|uniref:Uncharacterized protein n=1 Tax=Chlorella vulgaris TaxID=3077 RepID=A0A9D4TS83_CHLVU|nr:hypothetical protein D9Q98_003281 [Chlorella vulgaris]